MRMTLNRIYPRKRKLGKALSAALLALLAPAPAALARTDAFALHGTPALPEGFPHFPHVNPDAPLGACGLRSVQQGSFDTLNPFTLRGRFVMGVWSWVYETLMVESPEEPLVAYGHLAEKAELDMAAGIIRFTLRAEARWHDGKPVTAEDLLFSATLLGSQGRPHFRSAMAGIRPERVDGRTVAFHLPAGTSAAQARERMQRLGALFVLPKHAWEGRDFNALTLEPPLGSGPYRVAAVEPGRRVTFERVGDWWARDMPTGRGRWTIARMEVLYLRDRVAALEAVLADRADLMREMDPRRWATGYDAQAVRSGAVRKLEQPHWYVTGMNGFAFNLRRAPFDDIRVRQALAGLLDFDWANKALFHGAFRRTTSYFSNSPMAATEPPDAAERAAMAEFPALFPPEAFEAAWAPPPSDGSGRDRAALERAIALLEQAGWVLDARGRMVNRATGEPLRFSVLAQSTAQQALLTVWFRGLRRIGIEPRLEVLDAAAFTDRQRRRDFDLIYRFIIGSAWPGEEQRGYWGSGGASNLSGLSSAGIDRLLDRLARAGTPDEMRFAARLLDRALQWQWLTVPAYHEPSRLTAVRDRYAWPARAPAQGYGDDAWWCKEH
ncbi:extracellular solute-binding protein [Pseudoroseomonas cervicalis]|nr:extracellular solute-binding protein [Pseudoroseomonas cervicalis]